MNPLWPEKIGTHLARRHANPKGGDILWLNPSLMDAADAASFGIAADTPLHLIALRDYLPGADTGSDHYSVLAGEVVVGVVKTREPINRGWGWSQSCHMRGDQTGAAATLDEAKAEFAERFRRWLRTGQ